jgi:hypothetical protein
MQQIHDSGFSLNVNFFVPVSSVLDGFGFIWIQIQNADPEL